MIGTAIILTGFVGEGYVQIIEMSLFPNEYTLPTGGDINRSP
jgi:hypothetical protein